MHPHLVLGFFPWRGASTHFDLMGALRNTAASGVDPMVSIESIAHMNARGIASSLS